MRKYDVITVGGGLAGSSLARSLAEQGMKVLVLVRETVFRDRVRGEQMHPWGVAELRQLGLYDLLLEACGHELPWLDMFVWPQQIAHRDLTATTPQHALEFPFYHPAMQEKARSGSRERRSGPTSRGAGLRGPARFHAAGPSGNRRGKDGSRRLPAGGRLRWASLYGTSMGWF